MNYLEIQLFWVRQNYIGVTSFARIGYMSTTAAALPATHAIHVQRTTAETTTNPERLRAVLCGSFRRDPDNLRQTFNHLVEAHELLSPLSVEFVDNTVEFVRLRHELADAPTDIEQRHLDALTEADFIWLHAPEGYIGASAMFELGHAKALGIPIFTDSIPAEETYRSWVTVVEDPAHVRLEQSLKSPGNGLRGLQRYYERAAERRGWDQESARDTLLLLTEEVGELARAIRKSVGLARDGEWEGQDVAEELADVQLYVVHLSNVLGIDLANAVTNKEAVNENRVASRTSVA